MVVFSGLRYSKCEADVVDFWFALLQTSTIAIKKNKDLIFKTKPSKARLNRWMALIH